MSIKPLYKHHSILSCDAVQNFRKLFKTSFPFNSWLGLGLGRQQLSTENIHSRIAGFNQQGETGEMFDMPNIIFLFLPFLQR